MDDLMTHFSNVGSEWHRWDPHIHTPDTLHANQFKGGWEEYLKTLETREPLVEAVGVTEYCSIEAYKTFREHQRKGRAAGVKFAFPNVEFRLDIETERKSGINLHLLFDPADANHVEEIERVLSQLTFFTKGQWWQCTTDRLRALGRSHDPSQTDPRGQLRTGAMQFKLNREQLWALLAQDAWAKRNCLVAVSGREKDGTAGLQHDGGFEALRHEIEAMADIVFDSSPKARAFWLGRGPLTPPEVEAKYRSLKPCLHGSDAHSEAGIAQPSGDRRCWIRSALSFQGLKQTLLEPGLRVHIGPEPPRWAPPQEVIARVRVEGAPWLKARDVRLNAGLVAIIGPKGSGKTALADLIACTAGAEVDSEASFLAKAGTMIDGSTVELTWGDAATSGPVAPAIEVASDEETRPLVRYLSQQFVNRLCDGPGLTDELLQEIEDVIFQSNPETDRREAASFRELRERTMEPLDRLRAGHVAVIADLTEKIATDQGKKARLQKITDGVSQAREKLEKAKAQQTELLPKDKTAEATVLRCVADARRARATELERLKAGLAQAADLPEVLEALRDQWSAEFDELKGRFPQAGVTAAEWEALGPVFRDDVHEVLAGIRDRVQGRVNEVQSGRPGLVATDANMPQWSLTALQDREAALTREIGIEAERKKQYEALQGSIIKLQRAFNSATALLDDARGADERIQASSGGRLSAYAKVFETLERQREALQALYAPLRARLKASGDTRGRLEFDVRRVVDVGAWVERGEDLLDLRKTGKFQGRGTLARVAERELLPAWQGGDGKTAADAVDEFRRTHAKDLQWMMRAEVSWPQVSAWLHSTDHITLEYGVRFDGVDLAKLSPGMKGIVLLALYLAVDEWDPRPLVVDQPEENLDPKSVYDELVGFFRAAKLRRQVILVTHNPNLVVNTDADQVIVASAVRHNPNDLPDITYTSGGLDDHAIRKAVCAILEGGERAFRERERRYALPRDVRTGA